MSERPLSQDSPTTDLERLRLLQALPSDSEAEKFLSFASRNFWEPSRRLVVQLALAQAYESIEQSSVVTHELRIAPGSPRPN